MTGMSMQEAEEALPAARVETDLEESYNRLSTQAQSVLLCLAPFHSVFFVNLETNYFAWLKEQPALSDLVIEQEVLQEVRDFGLLVPDAHMARFLRLEDRRLAFLRARLDREAALREAIERAFWGLYSEMTAELYRLLSSANEQEKRLGVLLTRYEQENLRSAVEMALRTGASMTGLYAVLSTYVGLVSEEDGAEAVRQEEGVAAG